MDDQTNPKTKSSKNRGTEAFDIGSVAVDSPGQQALPPQAPPPLRVKPLGSVALLEPGEILVNTVRRHVIGIIGIYLESLAALIALAALLLVLVPSFSDHISHQDYGVIGALAIFVCAFLGILLLISTKVYRGCRLLITDRNLVMITQRSLFNRKISRLSMSNVEDVNVEQRGVLPSILNYGILTIQTAGEIDNFIFKFCPQPNDYAQKILEARERYVKHQA